MLIFALLLIAPWIFALVFTPVVIGWPSLLYKGMRQPTIKTRHRGPRSTG